ncbi:AAA family ATPase, partial [Clostridium perfringens]|nr:AAA family ATPase [Clostridium perfringens]
MDRLNLINRLKSSLESYFINSNNKEWINIDIVNVNRVDLTIVSEKGENIKECEQYIDLVIKNLNDKIQNNYEKLYLGMIKIYTVDEAEFFEIVKPKKLKEKGFTFGELVDELGNDSFTLYNKNDKYTKSKIVSFYSYKGGVGRTVTLIQTAHLLADKGKKVAIIDLDIEAPSFNDVFEDDINGEKGIINYLYNKLYNIKSDENDSIAKFVSKLNVNSDGEVYVIPAGEISLKYIKMLELLKERRIYENQYITEFIMELEKQYNIDYVLIDSRTGLNNWGALSIADISDEVFLCAYPNKENVKGINLILSLIKGRKKCNVIFSRIDNSDEGIEKAKELFGEIDVEQEFIGILYDKRIALGNKYPIESINNGFYNISEYLLEDEVRKWNKRFIDLNPDVNNDVLNKISERENFENIYTSSEKKILDTSNLILIKEKDINVEELIRKIEAKYNYIKIDDFKVDFSKS